MSHQRHGTQAPPVLIVLALVLCVAISTAMCYTQTLFPGYTSTVAQSPSNDCVALLKYSGGINTISTYKYSESSQQFVLHQSFSDSTTNFLVASVTDGCGVVYVGASSYNSNTGIVKAFHSDLSVYTVQPTAGSSASDEFGYCIEAARTSYSVYVGAPGFSSQQGGVFLLHFNGTQYVEQQLIQAPTPVNNERFGSSFDVDSRSERFLVVGAPNALVNTDTSGRLLFMSLPSYNVTAVMYSPDTVSNCRFGSTIALGGTYPDLSVIAGTSNCEFAVLFTSSVSMFDQNTTLTSPIGTVSSNNFATRVAISGDGALLAIGSTGAATTGNAYVSATSAPNSTLQTFNVPGTSSFGQWLAVNVRGTVFVLDYSVGTYQFNVDRPTLQTLAVTLGSPFSFVSGSAASYQWYRMGKNAATFSALSGMTAQNYSSVATIADRDAQYQVRSPSEWATSIATTTLSVIQLFPSLSPWSATSSTASAALLITWSGVPVGSLNVFAKLSAESTTRVVAESLSVDSTGHGGTSVYLKDLQLSGSDNITISLVHDTYTTNLFQSTVSVL
jgi:hypothetical protein